MLTIIKTAWNWVTGNLWTVYLAVALAVVAIIGYLAWSREEVKAELATSQANARTWEDAQNRTKAAFDELTADKAEADKALAQRDEAMRKIEKQRAALAAKLTEAKRNDPKVRAWADAPVPDAVRGLLRD